MARSVSDRTVQRYVYETKYLKCVVKKPIRIRDYNVKKRLAWWKNVIYSDECKVELEMDKCVRPGKECTASCLNPGRSVRVSLMNWGYITYEGVGTLKVVDGNINAHKYIEVSDNFVWPVIARHCTDDNYVFHDDNTSYIGHA